MRRVVVVAALVAGLASPSAASAANFVFDGKFTKGTDTTVHFLLTHHGTELHGWAWTHMPVLCREGPDVNSSQYSFKMAVKNGKFHAKNVKSSEGFTTTLQGTISNHNKKAAGTLSMTGPEPPTGTHCHGTGHWTADGVKIGSLVYPTHSQPAASNARTLGTVDCPQSHSKVTGGGIRIDGARAAEVTGSLAINETFPIGNGWAASAGINTPFPATMSITAICSNATYDHHQSEVVVPAHGRADATVLCRSHTHIVGGGVSNTLFDRRVQVGATRPVDAQDPDLVVDDGWKATMFNPTTVDLNMQVDAICSPDNAFEYVHSNAKALRRGDFQSDKVSCPPGTQVIGGGVELKGDNATITNSFPFDSHDSNSAPDNGWQGSAFNGSFHTSPMTVFAICEK